VARTKKGSGAALGPKAQAGDISDSSTSDEPSLLIASAAASAQGFALLAVPSHAQTIAHAEAESADSKLDDKPSDPISEAGWLAAADALLMGGLLGEW
jgi:hypothetical protein